MIAGMSPNVRVIAWDAPGYGGSTPLPSDHDSACAHADMLKAFCDSFSVRRAHIVGSSWGGALAISFARRHPHYVQSLTLLAPNRCFAWLPAPDREGLRERLLDPGFIFNASKDDFLGMLIAPDSEPLVAERAFALRDQLTETGYQHAVDMMLHTDSLANADKLTAPTIVLTGERDVLAPADDHARPIAKAIQGSEIKQVPECGHLIELECPQTVISAINQQMIQCRSGIEA